MLFFRKPAWTVEVGSTTSSGADDGAMWVARAMTVTSVGVSEVAVWAWAWEAKPSDARAQDDRAQLARRTDLNMEDPHSDGRGAAPN